MSEVRVNFCEPESGTCDDQGGSSVDHVKSTSSEASRPDPQGLVPADHPSSDVSPSPSAETSGLLSLPWEMVTHIASHLPAHCVITVLPKVCHALSNVGKDSMAWQLRARRLIGSRANFPVGPREDFDWPTACLEMEQLITCWTNQRKRASGTAAKEDGREGEIEGVGVAAQEVAYGVDEGVEVAMEGEDGEIQPIVGGDQLVRLREELEERLEDNAAALIEEERDTMQRQTPRSPSPPPALECITLPSGHIAQVNSVLLVGGEGAVCATGSRDWNVKLWDLQAGSNGTLLHTLGGQGDFSTHRGWVWCLASQGPLLASGGFDSTVRLWDLEASGAKRGLIRAGAAVLCLSCQTDVLLAGTFNKRVNMYDTRAAEPLVKSLRLHGNAVMCLAADDNYIISGSKDCTVAVYDRRAGKVLKNIRLKSYLLSMSYSGSEIWAGDNRGMLHSFSMETGTLKPLSQFDVGHTALVTGIHRSPGSLYTSSSDRTVKVHIPSAPPRTLCTLHHHAGVNGLSVNAGVLAVASGDVCVDIWRPRK
uniref:F-box and WD repeat domain containing 9 n=1 Tax=Anabas testudineus TaxID=64144 RepID=A0A3Q1JX58_ANATE